VALCGYFKAKKVGESNCDESPFLSQKSRTTYLSTSRLPKIAEESEEESSEAKTEDLAVASSEERKEAKIIVLEV
jgi:hypothetical protein